MHKCVGSLALLVVLALVLPLAAQQQASSFLSGIQPSDLHFQKVNANRAAMAFNHATVIQPPTVNKTFSLLPHLPNLNWLPRITWSKPKPAPAPRHRRRQSD
jgi:hypothetical protein